MHFALTDSISDLLEQPIPERGVNAMLHCPFHEDRTPSFSIHLEEGVWHCFSCGESGSLKWLYKLLGKDVDVNVRLYQAKKTAQGPAVASTNFAAVANKYYRDLRSDDGKRGYRFLKSFLRERGISESAPDNFGIGWDRERDTLAFPYADTSNRVTGIKHRYRNGFKASETGSQYGLYNVNGLVGKDKVIICEGESDTLRVWSQYGERYGVGGTSGASVSDAQWSRFAISLLFASRVYLLYDADEAGDKCAETAMRVLGDDKCVILRPRDGQDATDFLESGHTLEELGLE